MLPPHASGRLYASFIVLLLALFGVGLAGCGESDPPPECTAIEEGELLFDMDPQDFAEAGFRYAGVELVRAEFFSEVNLFVFRRPDLTTVQFFIPELGFQPPIEVGSTYTLEGMLRGGVPAASGLKIFDDQGLLYLAVTDSDSPSGNRRIWGRSYGDLAGAGTELTMVREEIGCEKRDVDDQCFREFRNLRLSFRIEGQAIASLAHGETAIHNGWIYHVHKAVHVVVDSSCPNIAGALQNQFSFFVQREGSGTVSR